MILITKDILKKILVSETLIQRMNTKRLLKVASKDQDTIDFVIELLFDEAYLTLSEVIKISYKFLIPTRLLAFISKN